ncbi:hypothetical protein Tco_1045177 [Tanacetum coccineum]|uniref:RNA-directed DNA polymerase, eukaryota, reverse transcriptase zinc-binding domain protein n=1 Tax=Tanacetum coccineum TaxID=301880 RepID=A0ABQ5GS31_9ASTR
MKVKRGIGVSDDEVSSMASVIGCEAAKFPFKYLGVPVGCNMSRCSYWNDILQKFVTKLSAWKARMLSVGANKELGGAELSQLTELNSLIQNVVLSDSRDSWLWMIDADKGYSVASGRTLIDSYFLEAGPKTT